MWQSMIPRAQEDISVDEFFTKFVPDQFNRMNELLNVIDLSFLNHSDFRMRFYIDSKVYSVIFRNGKDLKVMKGAIDEPNFTLIIAEKDWRDAVTGKFDDMADDFTGDPTSLIDAKHYESLMCITGKVNMNLKKKDGSNLPFSLIFNDKDKPAVTVNLDISDARQLMNKSTTGLGLFMNGKLNFTGSSVLWMKLQTLL